MPAPDSKISAAEINQTTHREAWLDSVLDQMRCDLEEDRFASALGNFRQALGLSRGLPTLKARVDKQAEVHSNQLLPQNWRVAETILQEAAIAEPSFSPDPALLEKVKQARHHEMIAAAIYKADRLDLDGKTTEARHNLAELLAVYPTETSVRERIYALDHPQPSAQPALLVKTASNDVQTLSRAKHGESELDTEGTVTHPAPGRVKPLPTRIRISKSAWNAFKNFSALAATAMMLGIAGVLVWRHLSAPHASPSQVIATRPLPDPIPPPSKTPDNSVFQDIPLPPSDQDPILRAVRAYSETIGQPIGDYLVDEVDIQGKAAKVRYRPKEKGSAVNMTFSLVRQRGVWKVENVK